MVSYKSIAILRAGLLIGPIPVMHDIRLEPQISGLTPHMIIRTGGSQLDFYGLLTGLGDTTSERGWCYPLTNSGVIDSPSLPWGEYKARLPPLRGPQLTPMATKSQLESLRRRLRQDSIFTTAKRMQSTYVLLVRNGPR